IAAGARFVRARRAGRGTAVDGRAALLCRLATGDRACAGTPRLMAGLWPRPLGTHARPGDGTAHRRDDHRRDAILRSGALQRGTLHSLIVFTTLDAGRVLLLVENLSCALTISSYFASVVIGSFGTMCTI